MRTDGEIERLSEMPADSIAAATTKKDLGTSRWQLCGKATSLLQAYGRGPWQVLALNGRVGSHHLCPLLQVDRPCHRGAVSSHFGPEPALALVVKLQCIKRFDAYSNTSSARSCAYCISASSFDILVMSASHER